MVIGKSNILCLLGLCGTFFVFAGKLCDDNDRRCGRVVRDARVVSSNPGLGQLATGKLSLSTQQKNGYLFRNRERSGSERRGMGSDLLMLCPRYSGSLAPLPLHPLRHAKSLPLPFLMF